MPDPDEVLIACAACGKWPMVARSPKGFFGNRRLQFVCAHCGHTESRPLAH